MLEKKKYSIKFFEEDGSLIFELKKITESWLTLDKVNFLHAGLFNFEIYSNDVLTGETQSIHSQRWQNYTCP